MYNTVNDPLWKQIDDYLAFAEKSKILEVEFNVDEKEAYIKGVAVGMALGLVEGMLSASKLACTYCDGIHVWAQTQAHKNKGLYWHLVYTTVGQQSIVPEVMGCEATDILIALEKICNPTHSNQLDSA